MINGEEKKMLTWTVALGLLVGIILLLFFLVTKSDLGVLASFDVIVASGLSYFLVKIKRIKTALALFFIGLWIGLLLIADISGGLSSPIVFLIPLSFLVMGLIIERKYFLMISLVALVFFSTWFIVTANQKMDDDLVLDLALFLGCLLVIMLLVSKISQVSERYFLRLQQLKVNLQHELHQKDLFYINQQKIIEETEKEIEVGQHNIRSREVMITARNQEIAKYSNRLHIKNKQLEVLNSAINTACMVAETDTEGNIRYINEIFSNVSGFSGESLIGKPFSVLKSGFHTGEFYADMWRTINKGKVWYGQFKNRDKSGSIYWVQASICSILDEHGKIEKFVTIQFDITKEKEKSLEAIKAKEEALIASRYKSHFLQGMSHELKSGLNTILNYSQQLMSNENDKSSPNTIATMGIIKSANNLSKLINDVFDISKLENEKIMLNISEISIREFIENIRDITLSMVRENGNQLVCQVDDDLVLPLDEIKVRQLVVNLVENAAKFTKEGNILLKIAYDRENREDKILYIEVTDTGLGIPEDSWNVIFEQFTQVDKSHQIPGAGLGLSICKQLVDAMGGVIKVESQVGVGSSFKVQIPVNLETKKNNANIA